MESVDVPIIILTWNGWDDAIRCIKSIKALGRTYDIRVVDNCSAVDRSSEVESIDRGIRVTRNKENRGWAGGCNVALKTAHDSGCTFAYLLNQDTVVKPGFLETSLAAVLKDENLAAVGSFIEFESPAGYLAFDGSYYEPRDMKTSDTGEVSYSRMVNGAGMLVRLDAMEKFGYFDERYFMYGDEAEWCHRMQRNGLKVAVCGASRIVHKCGGSNANADRRYYQIRNRFLYYSSLGQCLSESTVSLASDLAMQHLITALRGKDRRAMVQAFLDGVNGRFGKRQDAKVGMAVTTRFECVLVVSLLHRLLKKLSGRGISGLERVPVSLLHD